MAEMKGMGGDVASCRELLGITMYEERRGDAASCRKLPKNGRNEEGGGGCHERARRSILLVYPHRVGEFI